MSGTQNQFSRMTTIEKNKIEINSQKQMRNGEEWEGEGVKRKAGITGSWGALADRCRLPIRRKAAKYQKQQQREEAEKEKEEGEGARAFYTLALISPNVLQLFFIWFSKDLLRILLILSNLEIDWYLFIVYLSLIIDYKLN